MSQEIKIGETTYNLQNDLKEIKDKIKKIKNLAPVSSAPQQVQVPQAQVTQGMFTEYEVKEKLANALNTLLDNIKNIKDWNPNDAVHQNIWRDIETIINKIPNEKL